MPGPPLHSLVKYDTPSLLTTKDKKPSKGGAKGGAKKLPPVEAKQPLTQTEDILNSILPPRCAATQRALLAPTPPPARRPSAPEAGCFWGAAVKTCALRRPPGLRRARLRGRPQ
eukprot:5416770-Prymnesium_polylepis.1